MRHAWREGRRRQGGNLLRKRALRALLLLSAVSLSLATPTATVASAAPESPPFFISYEVEGQDLILSWAEKSADTRYRIAREAAPNRSYDRATAANHRRFKRAEALGETFYLQAVDKHDAVTDQVYLSLSMPAGGAPGSSYQVSQSAGLRLLWDAPGYAAEVRAGDDGAPASAADGVYTDAGYKDQGADLTVELSRPEAPPATLGFGIAPGLLRPAGPSVQGTFQNGDRVWSMLRYSTFIPNAYVPVPATGCTGKYHGGDNRTFGFEGSARSRVEVKATWLDANANFTTALSFRRATGLSKAYDANYNLIQTKQADPAGAYLQEWFSAWDKSYITGKVKHSIGNPNCWDTGPNIDYNFQFTLYRNGSYYIAGEHDQAPSHEIYVMQAYHPSNYLSKNLYKFAFGGNFNYLFSPAPNKTFNVSGSGPFASCCIA